MKRSIVGKSRKENEFGGHAYIGISYGDDINKIINDGYDIVYEDNDEPVPESQYGELMRPEAVSIKDYLNNNYSKEDL